jgi:polyisoprenoid-binding protein YceI
MTRGKKIGLWVAGAIAALAILIMGGTWAYIHIFSPDPAPAFSLDSTDTTAPASTTTVPSATDSGASATTATTNSTVRAGTYEIASGSQAGYRVKEVLFGQSTTAVGRTDDVTGSVTLDGSTVSAADFSVDLTSVHSDKGQRDNQFQTRIMDTAQFPTATFKLTQPIDLGSTPADGKQVTAKATGDLTLHGTTRSVTFDVLAEKDRSTIKVVSQIPIVFGDFGIPNPSIGPASTEDHGVLEVSLVLSPG